MVRLSLQVVPPETLVPKAVSIHLTVVVTERGVSKWSPSYVHVIKLPHVGADYLISVNIDNLDMK
jgi:hypothetical protein